MDNLNGRASERVYRLQHLPLEIPERCWKELTEWLCALIESVMELCQRDLLSLEENETFLKWAGSDAEILLTSSERSEPQADMLLEALRALENVRRFTVESGREVKARNVLVEWLKFRQHVDQARWVAEESCRAWRAELKSGTIPDHDRVLGCIQTIEQGLPLLRSCRVEDGPAQQNAIEKCMILNGQLGGEANDIGMVLEFAGAVVHDKKKWAAFLEAMVEGRWLDSDSPRGYLNHVTAAIYSRDVQPDAAGSDSQGFQHSAGPGGTIKGGDALRKSDLVPLEELAETPAEATLERRFTQHSVAELERAAVADPDVARYLHVIVGNPKRKRTAIWEELGWGELHGKAVDRRLRRLRRRLKDMGAGMALRQVPTPGISGASQTVYFETLHDGARGREFGVWQHKPLKTRGK